MPSGDYAPRREPEHVGLARHLGQFLGIGDNGPFPSPPKSEPGYHPWLVPSGDYSPRSEPEHVGLLLGVGQQPLATQVVPYKPPNYVGPVQWYQDEAQVVPYKPPNYVGPVQWHQDEAGRMVPQEGTPPEVPQQPYPGATWSTFFLTG